MLESLLTNANIHITSQIDSITVLNLSSNLKFFCAVVISWPSRRNKLIKGLVRWNIIPQTIRPNWKHCAEHQPDTEPKKKADVCIVNETIIKAIYFIKWPATLKLKTVKKPQTKCFCLYDFVWLYVWCSLRIDFPRKNVKFHVDDNITFLHLSCRWWTRRRGGGENGILMLFKTLLNTTLVASRYH